MFPYQYHASSVYCISEGQDEVRVITNTSYFFAQSPHHHMWRGSYTHCAFEYKTKVSHQLYTLATLVEYSFVPTG